MIVIQKVDPKSTAAQKREVVDAIARSIFGCRIVRDSMGAPYLESGETKISISHTSDIVAFAYGEKEIGIDIELVDRKADHLVKRFAQEAEIEVCRNVMPQNPSLLVWCAKEAIYKTLHRQEVDFLQDMKIISAQNNRLHAIGDSQQKELEWEIRENLLIVYTI